MIDRLFVPAWVKPIPHNPAIIFLIGISTAEAGHDGIHVTFHVMKFSVIRFRSAVDAIGFIRFHNRDDGTFFIPIYNGYSFAFPSTASAILAVCGL
ncbi:hypothetical protein [Eubacterium pyruvativorans]|uniref:hypothetical protein n=1 Tax=Eubacterium pyruvativorans TaxID=155865 RepID=UPI001567235C